MIRRRCHPDPEALTFRAAPCRRTACAAGVRSSASRSCAWPSCSTKGARSRSGPRAPLRAATITRPASRPRRAATGRTDVDPVRSRSAERMRSSASARWISASHPPGRSRRSPASIQASRGVSSCRQHHAGDREGGQRGHQRQPLGVAGRALVLATQEQREDQRRDDRQEGDDRKKRIGRHLSSCSAPSPRSAGRRGPAPSRRRSGKGSPTARGRRSGSCAGSGPSPSR